jgi:hypothetical protein
VLAPAGHGNVVYSNVSALYSPTGSQAASDLRNAATPVTPVTPVWTSKPAGQPTLPGPWVLSAHECGYGIGCRGDEARVVIEVDLALRLEPKLVFRRFHRRVEGVGEIGSQCPF